MFIFDVNLADFLAALKEHAFYKDFDADEDKNYSAEDLSLEIFNVSGLFAQKETEGADYKGYCRDYKGADQGKRSGIICDCKAN